MNIAGYILAGGDNRRMDGRKKIYLQRDGKTFGQWICEAFSELSGIYLSVADEPWGRGQQNKGQQSSRQQGSGQQSREVSAAADQGVFRQEAAAVDNRQGAYEWQFPKIRDRYGHIGPIGGIASGLSQCRGDALFVAACDMPFVSREAVRIMAEAFERKPVLTIASSGDRLHPLFGIYPRTVLPVLERQIQNQNYRMMNLLELVEYQTIDFGDDSPELRNINTREQYEQIRDGGDTGRSGISVGAGDSGQPETSVKGWNPGQPEISVKAGNLRQSEFSMEACHPIQPETSERTDCRSPQRLHQKPFIFAISGYKNSGKTTLITRLVPVLVSRGYRVAVIKHDGHDFESDVPGTDSYRHQKAGAYGTAVYSAKRMMITKEIQGIDETQLFAAFPEADIILIEGLKNSSYPKYFCNYPEEEPVPPEKLAEQIVKAMQEV